MTSTQPMSRYSGSRLATNMLMAIDGEMRTRGRNIALEWELDANNRTVYNASADNTKFRAIRASPLNGSGQRDDPISIDDDTTEDRMETASINEKVIDYGYQSTDSQFDRAERERIAFERRRMFYSTYRTPVPDDSHMIVDGIVQSEPNTESNPSSQMIHTSDTTGSNTVNATIGELSTGGESRVMGDDEFREFLAATESYLAHALANGLITSTV